MLSLKGSSLRPSSKQAHRTKMVRDLYAMGADREGVYCHAQMHGLACWHNDIRDSRGVFEARKNAMSFNLRHIIQLDLDICDVITAYVPYISPRMIEAMPHQRGMKLGKRK